MAKRAFVMVVSWYMCPMSSQTRVALRWIAGRNMTLQRSINWFKRNNWPRIEIQKRQRLNPGLLPFLWSIKLIPVTGNSQECNMFLFYAHILWCANIRKMRAYCCDFSCLPVTLCKRSVQWISTDSLLSLLIHSLHFYALNTHHKMLIFVRTTPAHILRRIFYWHTIITDLYFLHPKASSQQL